jgi:tripartite-type tricarboxylate transporter receptor subunit TctC
MASIGMDSCNAQARIARGALAHFLASCRAALPLVAPAGAWAQTFPSKPIRIVVPSPAGGPSDFAARMVSLHLPEAIRQSVIVDNRPGGAGVIGVEIAAKSAPDGYTLLVGSVGLMCVLPFLIEKLPYDAFQDFIPITNLIIGPTVLMVHPSVPARSLKELIALAKARPGQLTYGSTGPGQISHLSGELLKRRAGIDILHVPYKGTAPLFTQLVGGEISMNFSTAVDGLAFMRAGRLRAIAVTSLKRSPAMPEIPTMDESGLKGFEASNWNGIWAPAKTPRDVIERLNRDIVKSMQAADVRERVTAQGNAVASDTPEQFAAYVRAEAERWSKVVKDANIRIE